jgi:hypothetical protein
MIRKIRNYADLMQAQAKLAALKEQLEGVYTPHDWEYAVALQDDIFAYVLWIANGVNYPAVIRDAVGGHLAANNKKEDLFVIISHGVDGDLNPHAGCVLQLTHFGGNDSGGWLGDSYLCTALIPVINKTIYKEITRFLRSHNIVFVMAHQNTGMIQYRINCVPLSDRLRVWKRFAVGSKS